MLLWVEVKQKSMESTMGDYIHGKESGELSKDSLYWLINVMAHTYNQHNELKAKKYFYRGYGLLSNQVQDTRSYSRHYTVDWSKLANKNTILYRLPEQWS